MSVITTADEMFEESRKHLREARMLILRILTEEPWGHDSYQTSFLLAIVKQISDVIGEAQ